MPIYEYECLKCDLKLERLQKVTDAVLVKCPKCGHDSLQRLVSAAGFRLKGSGWYETDFKTDKDKKKNLADSSTANTDKSKGESTKATAKADKTKKSNNSSTTSTPK